MFKLRSTTVEIIINPLGAEIQQLKHATHGNILWQKNDQIWETAIFLGNFVEMTIFFGNFVRVF